MYHACPKCYLSTTFNTIFQDTMENINKRHLNRIQYLKLKLTHLIEIWECEWDAFIKTNILIQSIIKENDDIRPVLKPRDALFGGRTNAARLYYKVEAGEKIKYYDFTSVYPFVMKTQRYPIGFPDIITENLKMI